MINMTYSYSAELSNAQNTGRLASIHIQKPESLEAEFTEGAVAHFHILQLCDHIQYISILCYPNGYEVSE